MELLNILKQAIELHSIDKIQQLLFVDKNTINRWLKLNNVPNYYYFDLCNLMEVKIDLDKFSFSEKDQFFTSEKNIKYCLNVFKNKLNELNINSKEYTFIEPSAGNASFYKHLPENRRIGFDIQPRYEGIIEQNYLYWTPSDNKKYIVLGNPPFGLRGNLALRFINHSAKFADFVAFILPPLFNSTGKGNCMGRIQGMNLIHTENIDPEFLYPDGSSVNVNCIFQIWAKNFSINTITNSCSEYIKIYSVSDGEKSSAKRNVKMLDKCDIYLPSTCFSNKMKVYLKFEDLPQKRGYGIKILKDYDNIKNILINTDWLKESFKSTNSATNLRTDIIENVLIKKGIINNT